MSDRVTRIVTAGSGFLSQHSKELLFGLGKSTRITKVDDRLAERHGANVTEFAVQPADLDRGRWSIRVRSEAVQESERADEGRCGAFGGPQAVPRATIAELPGPGCIEPFPAPDFALRAAGRSRPIRSRSPVIRWLSPSGPAGAPPSLAALQDLSQTSAARSGRRRTAGARCRSDADGGHCEAASQASGRAGALAGEDVAGPYNCSIATCSTDARIWACRRYS